MVKQQEVVQRSRPRLSWQLLLFVLLVFEQVQLQIPFRCYSFGLIADHSSARPRRVRGQLVVLAARNRAEATTTTTTIAQQSNEERTIGVEDHSDVKWNVIFEKLKDYLEVHQTCKVPYRYRCEDGTMLGLWVRWQRYIAKKDKMRLDRRDKLDSIGFVWQVLERPLVNNTHVSAEDKFNANWDIWLEKLIEYKNAYGDCLVPQRYCCENGMKLGQWVSKQRHQGSTDKQMNPVRRDTLNSIGFVWQVKESLRSAQFDKQWNDMFRRLQEYHAVHNNCLVPKNYVTKDGKALGEWVRTQRTRIAAGKMYRDRLLKLQSLDFVLRALPDESIDARWNRLFLQLVEYQKQHGDCLVPIDYPADPVLAKFVGNLRQAMHDLPEDQRAQLDSIGFVWKYRELTWYAKFNELKKFQIDHGHWRVPRKQNSELHRWLYRQRERRRLNKLDKTRQELLDSIGFVWSG